MAGCFMIRNVDSADTSDWSLDNKEHNIFFSFLNILLNKAGN